MFNSILIVQGDIGDIDFDPNPQGTAAPAKNDVNSNTFDPSNPSSIDYSNHNFDITSIPPQYLDFDKLAQYGRLDKLTVPQLTYTGGGNTLNFDKVSDKNKLNPDVRNEVLEQLGRTTESVQTNTNNIPTEIESTPNGFYIPESIYQFSLGDVSVSQGRGIRYENNVLTIQEADTIQIKDGLIVQARNFTGNSINFSVGRAENVIVEGTTITGISNSTFEITDEGMRIDSRSDNLFAITDSTYVTSTFKGNGTLIIETKTHATNTEESFAIEEIGEWVKGAIVAIPQDALVMVNGAIPLPIEPSLVFEERLAESLLDEVLESAQGIMEEVSVYTVTDGTLTFASESGIVGISSEYNETIDALNSTAVIIIDPANGVACTQLMPQSAYHYIDPVIEKDFSLYVPKNGNPYALCLKKSASQQLFGYEGIVDFTMKEMDLKNVINYKRYPLKNNRIAGALTTEVFEGTSNARAELRYQQTFILLDSIMLHDVGVQFAPLISRTNPSNYYSITEEILEGQKKRLATVNWKLAGNQYTQSILQSYGADDLLPKLTLVHNVLIQDNGISRTTLFPPEHEAIETLVE